MYLDTRYNFCILDTYLSTCISDKYYPALVASEAAIRTFKICNTLRWHSYVNCRWYIRLESKSMESIGRFSRRNAACFRPDLWRGTCFKNYSAKWR